MRKFSKSILPLLLALIACEVIFTACDKGNTQQTEPPHTHTFGDWQTITEPTCTETGSKERICECGEKESETLDALDHTEGEWIINKEASFTENGSKHLVCSVCETTIKAEEIVPYRASIYVKFIDFHENVIFATKNDEPHKYCSSYHEPEIFVFLDDFAFKNSEHFHYKRRLYNLNGQKVYTLEAVEVSKDNQMKEYSSNEQIIVQNKEINTQTTYLTYWTYFINGQELETVNGTILKDGDLVEIKLVGEIIKEENIPAN